MQVENVLKLADERIILAGRNTGGIKKGDVLVDLDNKIKMKVIGIEQLYCSDVKKMIYLNSHPPICVDVLDKDLEALKGLILLRNKLNTK